MAHDQPSARKSHPHSHTHELASQVTGTSELGIRDIKIVERRLRGRLEPSTAPDLTQKFLPRNALTEILTDHTIQSILQQTQKPDTDLIDLAEITGRKKRIKIFAILLLIGKTEHLGHLIQQGFSDDDLPLGPDHLTRCLGSYATADYFLVSQFRVLVPVWNFSAPDIHEEEYHDYQKLPFLTKCKLGSGGQGKVWSVEVHREHFTTRTRTVCRSNPMAPFIDHASLPNLAWLPGSLGAFAQGPIFCDEGIQ